LQVIQQDGRISNQDLADRIGLSPSPCLRRVRALEEAGIVTGYLAWHPLELGWLKKASRPIGLDVSTLFGVGYGIVGQNRGMDGLVLQWGLNIDYFFARTFGIGLFAKGTFLQWDKFYLDYNNRDLPGNTLPVSGGSVGSFWTLGLALNFRAGE
jgi:hypothetical protein